MPKSGDVTTCARAAATASNIVSVKNLLAL
jgi:hypothetical protein